MIYKWSISFLCRGATKGGGLLRGGGAVDILPCIERAAILVPEDLRS